MTASEAIKWLKSIDKKYIHGGDEGFDNSRKVAISTAISALEKQIPKKRAGGWYGENTECPICHIVASNKYCPYCGHRLE